MKPLLLSIAITLMLGSTQAWAREILDLALIVGNNQHLISNDRTLRYADDDALMAADRFLLLHPQSEMWLLVDPDQDTQNGPVNPNIVPFGVPTAANWEKAIGEIALRAQQVKGEGNTQIRLFVHFAGHGEQGGTLHLADQPLSSQAFRHSLARVGADQVFALMDGCHLGQLTRGEGQSPEEATVIFINEELELPSRPPWLALIGSTTVVPEPGYLGAGLVTLVGLTGLLGPADLDENQQISFNEWSRYVEAQLNSLPGAPKIVAVPPGRDHLATVVDLSKSQAGGIRLSHGFRAGQVRIINKDTGLLTAEFYHHGHRDTTIRLRPGHYELLRLGGRDDWQYAGFPAERRSIQVKDAIETLDGESLLDQVVLVLEDSLLRGDLPEGIEVISLSLRDIFMIEHSPFRQEAEEATLNHPSQWSALLFFGPSNQGPRLSETNAPGKSLAFGGGWQTSIYNRSRGITSLGFSAQYTLQDYENVGVAYGESAPQLLRHELRVGPILQQSLVLPSTSLSMSLFPFYGPGFATAGGHILTASTTEGNTERFLYPKNVGFLTRVALSSMQNVRWNFTPTLQAGMLRLHVSSSDAAVNVWLPFIEFGLGIEQSVFRSR